MTLRPVLPLLLALGCTPQRPGPAALDTRTETCAWCRMGVSDARLAAQLVASAEEPRFFDDIGCLRDYLRSAKSLPRGTVAYVADHTTRTWVAAAHAVYTRVPSLETPMNSHLIAHADTAARDRDPDANAGALLTPRDVFGAAGPPEGVP
jgi:copper chaperone NosL